MGPAGPEGTTRGDEMVDTRAQDGGAVAGAGAVLRKNWHALSGPRPHAGQTRATKTERPPASET